MLPQLENTPLPLATERSNHFVDDISDINDSDSDDDLSPILDAMTVSSIVLSCILEIVYLIPH
jgi:hypothetical protein